MARGGEASRAMTLPDKPSDLIIKSLGMEAWERMSRAGLADEMMPDGYLDQTACTLTLRGIIAVYSTVRDISGGNPCKLAERAENAVRSAREDAIMARSEAEEAKRQAIVAGNRARAAKERAEAEIESNDEQWLGRLNQLWDAFRKLEDAYCALRSELPSSGFLVSKRVREADDRAELARKLGHDA